MSINPTVVLTLMLLTLMAAAGVVSGSWGYSLGREALRGITQPNARPGSLNATEEDAPHREEFTLLNEADIINDVKARMAGAEPEAPQPPQSQSESTTSSASPPAESDRPAATAPDLSTDSDNAAMGDRNPTEARTTAFTDDSAPSRQNNPDGFLEVDDSTPSLDSSANSANNEETPYFGSSDLDPFVNSTDSAPDATITESFSKP